MKVIHIFTQEYNFDRNYVNRDVSETFFIHPTGLLVFLSYNNVDKPLQVVSSYTLLLSLSVLAYC